MNRKSLIPVLIFFVLLAFYNSGSFAQETASGCRRVLKKEISEITRGECKNGLAEGNGMAKGRCFIFGSFQERIT